MNLELDEGFRDGPGRLEGTGMSGSGRVDLRADANGLPDFMEVNPLAGLHPEHSDLPILCTRLGITYRELKERIMQSARVRIRSNK